MDSHSSPLTQELLDDFYAESDELLNQVRLALAALENPAQGSAAQAATFETISREIHTLKGNGAIVGISPVEQLAHAMEDLLRVLSRGEVPLTVERRDALSAATQRLEQLVAAHRAGGALPEILDVQNQLELALQTDAASSARPSAAEPAAATEPKEEAPGRAEWRARFEPSPERDARGINIGAVRARLAQLGKLTSGMPVVENGRMHFLFTLALTAAPPDLAAWETDGVTFERIDQKAAAPESAAWSLSPSHLVRVDLSRLDELMRLTGELVIQRSRLHDRLQREADPPELLTEIDLNLGRSLRALRQAIVRIRMLPIGEVFARIPLIVRDLTTAGQSVRVAVEGPHTEIDKFVAESLKEPLLHLVRNALTHGIEPVAERRAAGKPPEATLTLRAFAVGEMVTIEVEDDGRGIDETAVRARARERGLAAEVADGGLLQILCSPGFSTRDLADRAAGRGIGMAVVAKRVRELSGTVALFSQLGRGTRFVLRLPLTLSILDVILLSVEQETFAVPQSGIDEVVQVEEGAVRQVRETEVVPYRGGLLPVLRLRTLFGVPSRSERQLTVLVVHTDRGAIGLVADRVHSRREVVVRPLQDPLVRVRGFAGATELGDGRPILVLDPSALATSAVRPYETSRSYPLSGS